MRKLTARLAFCVMAIVIAIGVVGCNDFERTTYQTLSASKATIDQIAADYNAGKIKETPTAFKTITDLRAAQTAAVNAMVEYETIKAAKGSQSALQAQQSIVANALAALPPLIVSAKALYTNLSSSSVQRRSEFEAKYGHAAGADFARGEGRMNAPRPTMQPIAAQ